jgi:hypothetical protein
MPTWLLCCVTTLVLLLSAEARAEESCRTCHPDVRIEYEASVHGKAFSCTECHGGDPELLTTESHSLKKKYVGKFARRDIPALCASCHANPNRMKPYGLSTDQYAQYLTSQHGLLLAKGDTYVAVCTDCHGVHGILPRGEPNSPVAVRNIPATCGRCHADQALMVKYKLPADQIEKFSSSVHGRALFVDQYPSAPTCTTCHGEHGAVPLAGEAGTVCGHCHSRTREYFRESPHTRAVQDKKMSECVSCHGYHDISAPGPELFDTACQSCHKADTAAFLEGQKLKTLLIQTNESLETALNGLNAFEEFSPTIIRYRPHLQEARANFMEALPVQHSLNMERVEDLARKARTIGEDVQASVHGVREEIRLRYIALAVAWVLLLFAVSIAYLYRQERRRLQAKAEAEARRTVEEAGTSD